MDLNENNVSNLSNSTPNVELNDELVAGTSNSDIANGGIDTGDVDVVSAGRKRKLSEQERGEFQITTIFCL